MILQKTYNSLPDDVKKILSYEQVMSYVFKGPFLPKILEDIKNDSSDKARVHAILIYGLRNMVMKQRIKTERDLDVAWKKLLKQLADNKKLPLELVQRRIIELNGKLFN